MEVEFGTKEGDIRQQEVPQSVESATDLRVNEKYSRKTTELGESHSKVDDCHKEYKSETHYAGMHMYEEDSRNIAKREIRASLCVKQSKSIFTGMV